MPDIFRIEGASAVDANWLHAHGLGTWEAHIAAVQQQAEDYTRICGYRQENGVNHDEASVVRRRMSGLLANRTASMVMFNSPLPHDLMRDMLTEAGAKHDSGYDFCGIPLVDVKSREYIPGCKQKDFVFMVPDRRVDYNPKSVYIICAVDPGLQFVDICGIIRGRWFKKLKPLTELENPRTGHSFTVTERMLTKHGGDWKPSWGIRFDVLPEMWDSPTDEFGCKRAQRDAYSQCWTAFEDACRPWAGVSLLSKYLPEMKKAYDKIST